MSRRTCRVRVRPGLCADIGLRARTRRRRWEPSLSSKHRARATIKVITDTLLPSGAGLARLTLPARALCAVAGGETFALTEPVFTQTSLLRVA
jgi:hypothetical protein